MIIRQRGGNSGVAEYLVKGAKFDRHYSRDELDNRIIIDGDLEITNAIINSIPNKDQERYLHITLSFNEFDITPEKIQAVYESYKERLLAAYRDGEINTYAEIHWPKTQQLLNKTTGEMYDRYPHVHMVMPKLNLLTGKYANPTGLYERNMNIWEAIQEDVNNRHGLKSPAHSPRISMENYKSVLERHKTSQFKSSTGDLKKAIFNAVESEDIRAWGDFKNLVSGYGLLKIRNEGSEREYLALKIPGNAKFINFRNPIFSKEYIENRFLPREPLTQYQINNRLKQWEQVSRELKYVEDAGSSIKKQYRALDNAGREKFLQQREAAFYERYEVSEPERKAGAFRSGYSKFGRTSETDKRSLYELPPRHLVHDSDGGGTTRRTDLFLPADELASLQLAEANGNDGLHRTLHSEIRIIESKEQIKSLAGQIIFDQEERQAIDKAQALERFREIRLNLKAEIVLAYAQAHYLINPEEHKSFKAKDGSARINFGINNYNVSDFFTKGLGLEWEETKLILLSLYEAQLNKKYPQTVSNDIIKNMLAKFEESEYSLKINQHKLELEQLKRREHEAFRRINEQYRYNINSIYTAALSYAERNKRRALEAFFKLVLEEELKADMHAERERINQLKYPFSEHFKDYLTKEHVIDMSIIDELKGRFGYKPVEQEEPNGFSSGQPFEMLNGREAARRAKLMAQLETQGKPHTKYGYSFKDLLPEQKKDSVVFYHNAEKLFEARADKVLVAGDLNPDKVATALVYSMQRFGNPLDITGSNQFKEQVIDVAARSGLDVKFTDPVLNDALVRRLEELGLEGSGQQNSISPESLDLDRNLEDSVAVDQALRESKEREIENDLANMTAEMKELAAVSIAQRKNAHAFETITAETAELDAALFNELANTPAMQAHFATDMAKLGQENEEYRQAIVAAGIGSEVMLASHAAVKFRNELESLYASNLKTPEIAPEDWDKDAAEQIPENWQEDSASRIAADELEAVDDPFADMAVEPTPENLQDEPASDVVAEPIPENLQGDSASRMAADELEAADDPFADVTIEQIPENWQDEPVADVAAEQISEKPSSQRIRSLQNELFTYVKTERELSDSLSYLQNLRDHNGDDSPRLQEQIEEQRGRLDRVTELKADAQQRLYQIAPELNGLSSRDEMENEMAKSSEQRQIEKQVLTEMLAERLESGALEHATANISISIQIPATLSAAEEEKEERKSAEYAAIMEERQAQVASWTQEEAASQAQQDLAGFRQEENLYKQDYTARDMAFNADTNPKYREALESIAPGIMSEIEEHNLKSDAIHVEFKHGDRIFDQLELKKSPSGYEINAINTKTGESEPLEVSDNPKIIAENFTSKLPSTAGFDFNEANISSEDLNKQAHKISMAKISVKQMFALEPDSKLNADNLSAKAAVNELKTIKLSESEKETKQTAKIIVEKLNNIRNSNTESGKAEIRNAATVVAALCHNDQALADEIVSATDAESRPYISAIIEQGHDLNTKQLTLTHEASGIDMEI